MPEIEAVKGTEDLRGHVEHVHLAVCEVLIGQLLEAGDELLEHLVDSPTRVHPFFANDLFDRFDEGRVGGDELVRLEDRRILLSHLLRGPLLVFADVLNGRRDCLPESLDLTVDAVGRDRDAQS